MIGGLEHRLDFVVHLECSFRTIMTMTYYHRIHDRKVLDTAWHFGISFWPHKTERTTSFLEYWIEENS